jgi:hypothetical protein
MSDVNDHAVVLPTSCWSDMALDGHAFAWCVSLDHGEGQLMRLIVDPND